MIRTKEITIDLGGHNVKINVVENSEEILTKAVNDEETPLWVELWPSSLALARWLWNKPELPGKSVLELGSGLGLPGTVAGIQGARVLQTDYVAEALEVAEATAALNGVKELRTAVADWRNFGITETFDYIIGSDIMYHPELNPYLQNIFRSNLKPGGKIIMADAGRRDSLAFVKELAAGGWQVREEHMKVRQDRFDYRIYIFEIRPPAAGE